MSATPVERLNTALSVRYRIERELGGGGMATVLIPTPGSLSPSAHRPTS